MSLGDQSEDSAASSRALWKGAKFRGIWNAEMGNTGYEEGKDQGTAAYLKLASKLELKFTPWLRAFAKPRIQMYSSRLQERYDDDSYQNGLYAEEMFLSLQKEQYVQLHVGAIGQSFLDSPLLISQRRSFPGVRLIGSTETQPLKASVILQNVIPTSHSLNSEREDKEPLPTFQTQSLHLEYNNRLISTSAMVGHYRWAQIPNKVAFNSAIVGNTVFDAEVAPGARLAYGFDGIFWGEKFCLCGDRSVQFELDYMGEHNTAAPSDSADAQMFRIGPRFIIGDQQLELFYYNFFVESDATVAAYAKPSIGYTNRVGDGIEAKYSFKDKGFSVQGRWVNARTIQDRDSQKTFSEFYLGVEKDYASF